ncbi:hypothetical protein BDQ17DRAFT_1327748 [Cyathus striatus]|nr:hypothetical protein BDQ17DRAFT_1327748 [Cyathus striatus]
MVFYCLMFYDHALTFDVEMKVIWTLPWKGPKILFLLNSTAPKLCHIRKWAAWPIVISMASVEILLMIRVLAICGAVFRGCLYSPPKFYYITWLPPALFECILIILTVYEVKRYYSFSHVVQVLTRDSIIYFLFILGCLVALFIYPLLVNTYTASLALLPTAAGSCIGKSYHASRMSFNVRECVISDAIDTFEFEVQSMVIFHQGRRVVPEENGSRISIELRVIE